MNTTIASFTTVQLTEGRSIRDQPKQLPAKKRNKATGQHVMQCVPHFHNEQSQFQLRAAGRAFGADAVHSNISCQCIGSHSTTSTFHGVPDITRCKSALHCKGGQSVKRHTRATLQNPGHQGTYGGGMSDAPENSKTQTQVSPGSQVPH